MAIGERSSNGPVRPPLVQWIIAVALVVIACTLVVRLDPLPSNEAHAQVTASAGARGVFAFSGQLTKSSAGVFMVDMDTMTLWAYEYQPQQGKGCLRLVAGRTWKWDRYLENFNACGLEPADVEQMIADQRFQRMQETKAIESQDEP
jgi:hypothetical protein